MIGATRELGPCQVRSGTEHPCPRLAVVKLWGVPFCERCAREQEAYFAIGELTRETTDDLEEYLPRSPRDGLLVEALHGLRWGLGEPGQAEERLELTGRGRNP